MQAPAVSPQMLSVMTTRYRRIVVEVGGAIRQLYTLIANVDPEPITYNPFKEKQWSGLGTMNQKPEGTQFPLDNIIEGGEVTVNAIPWGKGFEFTFEAMKYDLYNMYDDISADMVRATMHRQELEFWSLFNFAFVTTKFKGFDGKALVATDHPYLDPMMGTQSNMSDTDISLSMAGLQMMELHSNTLNDERGMPDEQRRMRIILINPVKIPTARILMGSVYDPSSGSNAINPIVDSGYQYLPVRYLTSQQAWFGITEPGLHSLSVRFTQRPMPGSYTDPRNLSMFSTMYQNFAVWFSFWRGVWGSKGTGA